MQEQQQNQEITLSKLEFHKALDKGFFMGAMRGTMLGAMLGINLTLLAVVFVETRLYIEPNTLFEKDKIIPIALTLLALELLVFLKYRKSKQVIPTLHED